MPQDVRMFIRLIFLHLYYNGNIISDKIGRRPVIAGINKCGVGQEIKRHLLQDFGEYHEVESFSMRSPFSVCALLWQPLVYR